jgi:uncharacterized protein YbjT (DUF2867 family)
MTMLLYESKRKKPPSWGKSKMSIAITGPSGNIGSELARKLLDSGQEVILLAHHAEKVQEFVQRGATVYEGDLSDRNYVVNATKGVDAIFWLIPPNFGATDFRAYQNGLIDNAVAAIETNDIDYAVVLSSIGADLCSNTGPVDGLCDAEHKIGQAAENAVYLRAGFFYENLMMQADAIKQTGSFYLPLSGDRKYPMVATKDIAQVAAGILGNLNWSGKTAQVLQGPIEYSHNQIATILTQTIGKPVKFQPVTAEQTLQSMLDQGLSNDVANRYVELYRAVDTGYLFSGDSDQTVTTTPTTFENFAQTIIKPFFTS